MKSVVLGVASSVAAGAISYIVLDRTANLSAPMRSGISIVVFLAATAIAYAAARGVRPTTSRIDVGHKVRSKRGITIDGVDISRSGGDVTVGTNLEARGEAVIRNVKISPAPEE